MRRSLDQAFFALRQQINEWARGTSRPDIRVFVYPPEFEPIVLSRLPEFLASCESDGLPIEIIDVGQGFLEEIERRPRLLERWQNLERRDDRRVVRDLGEIAGRYLTSVLQSPLEGQYVARLLINTAAVSVFVSLSTITNSLYGDPSLTVPTAIAFPGEGDDRMLNLLMLRQDGNYRIPRI